MRSLFIKIFLSFWLAVTLIAGIGVILALTTDHPRDNEMKHHRQQLTANRQQMIAAYERGGATQLLAMQQELKKGPGDKLLLFIGDNGPLDGSPAPPFIHKLIENVLKTGEIQILPGPDGPWVGMPGKDAYILVTNFRPPPPLIRFFDPRNLGLRLVLTFFIAGTVCFLLARSLTSPIDKLRLATQQFAAGNLATRVSGDIRGKDEISLLAKEFDAMAERIQELVGSQQRLLRDISHELRSPLARLNVALELARQKSQGEIVHHLDRIDLEAERLNDMIGQLLRLTKMESGTEALTKQPVDLAKMVQTVAADADFEARSIFRKVVLTECAELEISGDGEMLHRAVENVVRNAIRYTDEKHPVEVSLQSHETDGNREARIEIRDYGPGLPEEALTKVFQPFYRISTARDRNSGGTGIGLAITDRSIRLHGGTVTASNASGGGLLVRICLPC